ncbi:hypothetical protein ACOMHN_056836 [Nucella lapillus]
MTVWAVRTCGTAIPGAWTAHCSFRIAILCLAFTDNGVTAVDTDQPRFLPGPSNVTFHRGDIAILPCAIHNVGTKTT